MADAMMAMGTCQSYLVDWELCIGRKVSNAGCYDRYKTGCQRE